jgi:hypothetical protein
LGGGGRQSLLLVLTINLSSLPVFLRASLANDIVASSAPQVPTEAERHEPEVLPFRVTTNCENQCHQSLSPPSSLLPPQQWHQEPHSRQPRHHGPPNPHTATPTPPQHLHSSLQPHCRTANLTITMPKMSGFRGDSTTAGPHLPPFISSPSFLPRVHWTHGHISQAPPQPLSRHRCYCHHHKGLPSRSLSRHAHHAAGRNRVRREETARLAGEKITVLPLPAPVSLGKAQAVVVAEMKDLPPPPFLRIL